MSKHSLRRILSLLLAVLMVCTLLPTAALAEDGAGTDDPAPKAEEEDAPETTAPAKPSAEEVEALFTDRALLEVQCTNPNHKDSAIHSLLPGCYEITDVVNTGGDLGYTCHVRISAAEGSAYVNLHDANTGASRSHMSLGGSVDHWLKYDSAAKKWTFVNDMKYTSVIYAICPPDDSLVSGWDLRITCGKCKDDGKQISWRDVALSNGEYSIGEVKQDGSGYYCEITVTADKYVETFSNETYIRKYHALAESEAAEKTFKVRFDGRSWPDNLYTIKDAFNVTCDAIPPEPAPPTGGFEKFIKDSGTKVIFSCADYGTASEKHYQKTYELMENTYEISDVSYDGGGIYSCTITLTDPEQYLEKYNEYAGKTHSWKITDKLRLFYTYNTTADKKWQYGGHTNFQFEVSCETPAPEKPGKAVVAELLKTNAVSVSCINADASHAARTYGLLDGTYTIGDVVSSGGYYTCTVTVQPEKYAAEYNTGFTYAGHTLSPAGQTGSVTLRYDSSEKKWTLPGDSSAVFTVSCAGSRPEEPNEKTIGYMLFDFICSDKANHTAYPSLDNAEDGYTISAMQGNAADGYYCEVTVYADKYIDYFIRECAYKYHVLAEGEAHTKTFNIEYKYKKNWGWTWDYAVDTVAFNVTCDVTPPKPDAPGGDFLTNKDNAQVIFSCETTGRDHKLVGAYTLTEGKYAVSVYDKDGDWYCDVTVQADDYLPQHDADAGKPHIVTREKSSTITFCYNLFSGEWENCGDIYARFSVACDIPDSSAPLKPTGGEVETLLKGAVNVSCHNIISTIIHKDKTYGLMEGTYTIGEVAGNADKGYTCTVTVRPEKYAEEYNSSITGAAHTLFPTGQTGTVTLKYDGTKWIRADDKPVEFTVTCDAVPKRPDAETIEKTPRVFVYIECRDNGDHRDPFADLIPGAYTVGEVTRFNTGGGEVYCCDITLTHPEKYVEAFDDIYYKEYKEGPHALFEVTRGFDQLIYKYDEETDQWKWELYGYLELIVECRTYTVTYTDGVDGKAFANQSHENLLRGTETPEFTGTPEREHYIFAGWNPAVTDTVTGDVAYTAVWKEDFNGNGVPDDEEERYTVTYTDGVGGKAFKTKSYENLLPGVDTPEFTGTPEQDHYVFAGWTPEIAKTVTADAAYTAQWTPVTYTVTYELNGGTAEGNPESYTVESGSFTLKNPTRSGYTFTGWSGTGLNGENNMTVTVEAGSTGDRAYTAHWRQNAYVPGNCTILAAVSGKGAISPTGSVSVSEGGSRTFTFTPDKGYALCNVLVDGKEIGAVESYTFKNIRSGHTIEAVFMEEDGNPKNGVTVSGKPSVTEKFKESTPEERREKLEAARKANGDTVAWLYIPAAEIDVPVLQTENNAFYLRMGADKSYAPWGSVYADGRAELKDREALSANTAIFGASAENGDPDGECFSKLFRYLDAEFVEENPYIYLTLANGEELVFRIGACFITDTEFDYIRPELKTDKEWNEYLKTVGKKNLFEITGGQLEKGDTLLTLTTYSAEYDTEKTGGQRFAVVAKLLPEGADTAEYTVKAAADPELP